MSNMQGLAITKILLYLTKEEERFEIYFNRW